MNNIDCLRATVSIATAKRLARLSPTKQHRFRRNTEKWLDESFFKMLSACEVRHFIECGAHEASASSRFMRSGGERALAIEANPLTYKHRTSLAESDGVTTINCGVGPERSEQEFFVPRNDQLAGHASFLKTPCGDYRSEKVEIRTVDELYGEHFPSGESIALWIDVEGLALEVLQGGSSLLNNGNCKVIKVEVETVKFWENQSLARNVHDFLSVSGYVPVLRDMEYVNQYNLIYVRSELVDSIEEILINSWQELALLKLAPKNRLRKIRAGIGKVKRRLTNTNGSALALFTHRIAARLGSTSSQKVLNGIQNSTGSNDHLNKTE